MTDARIVLSDGEKRAFHEGGFVIRRGVFRDDEVRTARDALERLMQGRTSLVIAHRLSTVVAADVIFVVQAGLIVERGTHSELLRNDGVYAKLFAEQLSASAIPELRD